MVFNNESHEIAAQAYFHWWNENKHKNFDIFKDIDPLANTTYSWY